MKIRALPSVIFATLVIALRPLLVTLLLTVIIAPSIAHAKSKAQKSKPRVAVLYFDNNTDEGKSNPLSKGFADMLITDLSASNEVTVVEREKLQALLDETALQQTKFFDPSTAVRIGKGLGATHVVAGAFMKVAPKMRVDVRLIEISTGTVVLSAKVQGPSNEVFELEQQLVEKFLKKFGVHFQAQALPPTKVPNLKALVSYSRALGLVDLGKDTAAATQIKALVSMAPAFALARTQQAQILARIASATSNRTQVLDRGVNTLYAHARVALSAKLSQVATGKQAAYRLGYRMLLRHEASVALYAALVGRSKRSRLVPRTGDKKALRAMRSYYQTQRLLIEEHELLGKKFPRMFSSFDLPDQDKALARKLRIKYSDGDQYFTMLRFLFRGRVEGSGLLESYSMSPAPSDLDPRLKKAALAMTASLIKNTATLPAHLQISTPVRALEMRAEFHIARERIEKGIADYQKILDGFPSIARWDFYEKRIHQQLGLEHDHLATKRREYSAALKSCDRWKINASIGPVLGNRVRYQGIRALPLLYKEIEKACKNSPKFDKIQEILYRNFANKAGRSDDCAFLNLYQKKWIALGGSQRSAALFRKRYICN
jgi:TolB-like protein